MGIDKSFNKVVVLLRRAFCYWYFPFFHKHWDLDLRLLSKAKTHQIRHFGNICFTVINHSSKSVCNTFIHLIAFPVFFTILSLKEEFSWHVISTKFATNLLNHGPCQLCDALGSQSNIIHVQLTCRLVEAEA